ncbi:MAG: NAD-dependent epimerase/dehydratase family protein [Chloroflexota bacterium]
MIAMQLVLRSELMRILSIGGTGFIGQHVVRSLAQAGHEVTVFHRGNSQANLPSDVNYIHGDRNRIADYSRSLLDTAPDVILDMMITTEEQARAFVHLFADSGARVVMVSSADVYRAYNRLFRREPGPPDRTPLAEEAPLREKLYPYRNLDVPLEVAADAYDKIPAENHIRNHPQLSAAILRLPMVFGPGDYLHRLYPYVRRMADHRPAILLQQDQAGWRAPRGYVENVAAAITLAVLKERRDGQIYNVAMPEQPTEAQWVRLIGETMGWEGRVVTVPKELLPDEMQQHYAFEQDWHLDTTRIRRELGYNEPVALDKALQRTVQWELANPPQAAEFDYEAEDALLRKLEGSW